MKSQHSSNLPPWAHLSLKSNNSSDPTRRKSHPNSNNNHDDNTNNEPCISMVDEEIYLRSRTFHTISQTLDQHLESEMKELLIPIEDSIRQFLALHQEVAETSTVATNSMDATLSTNSTSNNNTLEHMFRIDPPHSQSSHYNQKTTSSSILLPMIVIRAPTHVLDRSRWTNLLFKSLKSKYYHLAVCHLSSRQRIVTTANHSTHCGHWLREIIRQCWMQENENHQVSNLPLPFPQPLDLGRVQRINSSQRQHLWRWARNTRRPFRKLLIILERIPSIHHNLQDFVSLLEQLRMEGLAVSLILVVSSSQRLHLDGNFDLKTLRFPSSQDILTNLWNSMKTFYSTTLLTPELASILQGPLQQQQQQSFVAAITLWKRAIAIQMSYPGSLLLENKNIHKDEIQRFECLFLTSEGRQALCGDDIKNFDSITKSSLQHGVIQPARVLQQIIYNGLWACHHITSSISFSDLILALHQPKTLQAMANKLTHELKTQFLGSLSERKGRFDNTDDCMKNLFQTMANMRSTLLDQDGIGVNSNGNLHTNNPYTTTSGKKLSQGSFQNSLRATIESTNEVIILLHKYYCEKCDGLIPVGSDVSQDSQEAAHLKEQPNQEDLWQAIFEWLENLLQMIHTAYQDLSHLLPNFRKRMLVCHDGVHDNLPLTTNTVTENDLMPQHRYNIAEALRNPDSFHSPTMDPILQVPSILFQLIENRIIISRYEWWQEYHQHCQSVYMTTNDFDSSQLQSLFSLGVYELLYLGLIREKRRGGNLSGSNWKSAQAEHALYEKAIFVWSTYG